MFLKNVHQGSGPKDPFYTRGFLAHLGHNPKSLCNHELSVVCPLSSSSLVLALASAYVTCSTGHMALHIKLIFGTHGHMVNDHMHMQ